MKYLVTIMLSILLLSSCRDEQLLKRFNEIEEQMKHNGNNISNINKDILNAFESDNSKRPAKVGPVYQKARAADSIAQEFISYVEHLKITIEKGVGGRNENGGLKNNSDEKFHRKLLIEDGEGAKLKQQINTTRTKLLSLLDKEDQMRIRSYLVAEDNASKNISWEKEMFDNAPVAAVTTILQKIINDAKNTEAQVLEQLALSIDKSAHTFDNVAIKVIPKAGCISKGGKFEAEIILVAYDSKKEYEVVIDGQRFKSINGVVDYSKTTTATGKQELKGVMELRMRDGVQQIPFETQFMVSER